MPACRAFIGVAAMHLSAGTRLVSVLAGYDSRVSVGFGETEGRQERE
jgi:hypothetical protein